MYKLRKNNRKLFIFSLCNFFVVSSFAIDQNNTFDATAIPFEELLQIDYIPASKIAEQISSSSSAVSVVTHREIKLYGYKTLAEILNSMRGLHTFQDYEYTFLGGRGYGTPGDYAGRIILLIDGYTANDSFYGQAFFSQDGLLDVSLIERVEYIPGGSSSGYTNNALLGVINIITKKGSSIDGTQVAYGYGSHNSKTRRVTFGQSFDNGADVLFSLSDYDTDGRDFTYYFGGENISNNNNNAKNHRIFFKSSYENLSLEGALLSHTKKRPSYPSTTLEHKDQNGFIRLKYDTDIAKNTKFSTSLWYGYYFYDFRDLNNNFFPYGTKAKWYGYDFKFIGTWFDNHTISMGTEYRHDYLLSEYVVYDDGVEDTMYPPQKTSTIYIYDNYSILPTLSLNYGARYEKTDTNNFNAISPQIALIWQASHNTALKLSASKTSRKSTVLENINDNLEKAKKTELVIEQTFGNDMKFLSSFYSYRIYDRFSWIEVPDIKAKGIESEINKYFDYDIHMKASYAYQKAYEVEGNTPLVNTPSNIAKLHLATPIIDKRLHMGLEILYLGSRPDSNQETTSSHTVTNLNFLSRNWIKNTDISLKINNIFNKSYGDILLFNSEPYYPQDGRTFYLEMEYRF